MYRASVHMYSSKSVVCGRDCFYSCDGPWTGITSRTTMSRCSAALKPRCRKIPEMIKRGKWKVTSCHISWSLGWNVRPAGPWGWHPPYTNKHGEWRRWGSEVGGWVGGLQRGEGKMREREKGVEHLAENREKALMVNKPMQKQLTPSSLKSHSALSPPLFLSLSLSIAVGVRQIPQPQSDRPSNDLARKPSIN